MAKKKQRDPEHDQFYHDLPPAWPPYCPKPRERVLAVMLGDGSILAETGEKWTPSTWEEMAALLFQENLQVFIGTVKTACEPWQNAILDELVGEKAGKLRGGWVEMGWNSNQQYLTGVKVHRKWPDSRGRMRWQVRNMTVSSTWARAIEPELLLDLRFLFELLETGVVATPGAAGYATMARLWKNTHYDTMPKHFRPPLSLITVMEKQAIGSRRETYKPTEVFETAYELDRSSGFAAEVGSLPCGPVIYLPPEEAHRELHSLTGEPERVCFTWWARCYVKILHDLPPGDVAPFAVRTPETDELEWPTRAGGYWTYLWKHEADEIQSRYASEGSMVVLSVAEAWVWLESTEQLAAWRSYMDAMRREAAHGEGGSKARGDLVKLCIVAGIGRLGLPYEFNEISNEAQEGSVPLDGAGLFDEPLYLKQVFQDLGTPKHWQCWILSQMNMKIYQVMRWGYLNGLGVVASNVDSVVFDRDPGWGVDPNVAAVGDFKRQSLGNYTACPYPGALLSPTKLTTPGMERKYRDRLMRIGEYKPEEERRRSHKQGPRDTFSRGMKARLRQQRDEIECLEQLRQFMLKVRLEGSG